MEKIQLVNRYNDKNFLEYLNGNWWELKEQNPDFTRLGAGDDNWETIDFVDPSGGPFMQVDHFIIHTESGPQILREISSTKPYTKILMRFENL